MTALGHDWPIPEPDQWRSRAACRTARITRPDLTWFPGQGERFDEQRAICESCPVRTDCLADAMSLPATMDHGLWGGLSERQRSALRAARSRRQVIASAPTNGGVR